MFLSAWLAFGEPAVASPVASEPIRPEAEVRKSGRQAVARYGDARLAALGFLDVTKAPYLADPTGKIGRHRGDQQFALKQT
jgi:hypothetical protein